MFNRGGDDVFAMRHGCFADSANRQVIRFRAPRSEYEFVRARSDQRRNLSSRSIDSRAGLLAEHVHTGRVAKLLNQKRQHCCQHTSIDWGRSAVIEINSSHNELKSWVFRPGSLKNQDLSSLCEEFISIT